MSETQCYSCGGGYKSLGRHWGLSKCEHKPFTERQLEMITGLLMGDGWMNYSESTANPYLAVQMINEEFITYLQDEFDELCGEIQVVDNNEERAKSLRESGLNPNQRAENMNDMYKINTKRHPQLQKFANWYKTGEKVFPHDLELTPTILKMWYVGDGSFNQQKSKWRPNISISSVNEMGRHQYIKELFSPLDVSPKIHEEHIRFDADDSEKLLNWMGSPPPGFARKWA